MRTTTGWVPLALATLAGLSCSDAAGPEDTGTEVEVVYTAISVSEDAFAPATCALTTARQAFCWGSNHAGKLGNAEVEDESRIPVLAAGGREFKSVHADWHKSCGLTLDGVLLCWGEFSTSERTVDPVAFVYDSPRFESVALAIGFGCGITAGGATYCWSSYFREPIPVDGLRFAILSGGTAGICGLTGDGVAYCWRNGAETAPDSLPTDLRFSSISGRCGLTVEGNMYCWGIAGPGDPLMPRPFASGMTFASISVGRDHSCATDQGGRAYCWGVNSNGQLGFAGGGQTFSPMPVSGDVRFRSVAADGTHTCGIDLSGVAYCWGSNSQGQLGDGSTPIPARYDDERRTPVRVSNPRM